MTLNGLKQFFCKHQVLLPNTEIKNHLNKGIEGFETKKQKNIKPIRIFVRVKLGSAVKVKP